VKELTLTKGWLHAEHGWNTALAGYANERIIETNGRRCIPYMNTGSERKRISVVLSVSEYGHKLHLILAVKDNEGWNKEATLTESLFLKKNAHIWMGNYGWMVWSLYLDVSSRI
jgi:hypothetical protein